MGCAEQEEVVEAGTGRPSLETQEQKQRQRADHMAHEGGEQDLVYVEQEDCKQVEELLK